MPRRVSEYADLTPLETKKRVFVTEVDTYIGRHILNYFTTGTRKNEFVVQGTLSETGFAKVDWPEAEETEADRKDAFKADPFSRTSNADSAERTWGNWPNPVFVPDGSHHGWKHRDSRGKTTRPSSQFPHALANLYQLVPRHMENIELFDRAIIESDIVVAVLNDSTHEAEVAIRIMSTTQSDCEKTFVVVSSVLTWANTRNAALAYDQMAKIKRVVLYRKLLMQATRIRKAQAKRIAKQTPKAAARDSRNSGSRGDDEIDGDGNGHERSEDDDGEDAGANSTVNQSQTADGGAHSPGNSVGPSAETQEQIDRFVDRTERSDLLPRSFEELADLLGWSASPSSSLSTGACTNGSDFVWERLQAERFAKANRVQVEPVEDEEGAPMPASDELVLNDLRELGVNLLIDGSTEEDVRIALRIMRRLEAAWLERAENEELDDMEGEENEGREPESTGFNEQEGLDTEPGKVWTEQEYQKRVPHAKYQHWKALEQLTKRSNSETLHTYVVFRGLAYGDGEEEGGILEYLCHAAWNGQPPPIIQGPSVADTVATLINYDQFIYRSPPPKHILAEKQRKEGDDSIVPFTVVDQFRAQDEEREAAEKHARNAEVFRRIVVAQCASNAVCAAEGNEKSLFLQGNQMDNHIPMIHITDLSRLVYQVATSYVTLEDRHIFAVDSGTVTLRSLLQAVYQVFKGPAPPPRLLQSGASANEPLIAVAAAASATAHVTPIPHHATAESHSIDDEFKAIQMDSLAGYEYLIGDVRCSPTLALEVIDGTTGGQRAGDDGVDEASKQVFENTEDAPEEPEDDGQGDDGGGENAAGDKLHGPSFIMDEDEAQHPQWMSLKGFVVNSKRVVKKQFVGTHRLQPMRVIVNGPPYSGKSSVAETLALMYNVPSLTLGDIVASYEEYAGLLEMRLRILRAQWAREQRRMAHALGIILPNAAAAAATGNGIAGGQGDSGKESKAAESGEDDIANESTNRSYADSEKTHHEDEDVDAREENETGGNDEDVGLFLEMIDSCKDGKIQFFADLHPAELLRMVGHVQMDANSNPTSEPMAGALLLPQPYEELEVSAEEKEQRKLERKQKLIQYFKSIRELYFRKATRLAKELNMARSVLSMKRVVTPEQNITSSPLPNGSSKVATDSKNGAAGFSEGDGERASNSGGEEEEEEEEDISISDPLQGLALHVSAQYAEEAIALMVRWRLRQKDCQLYGFILDGFPTTVRQAWLIFQNSPLLSNDDEEEENADEEGNEENGSEYSNEEGKNGERGAHAQKQNAVPVFDGMSIAREIMGHNPLTGEATDFLGGDGGGDEDGEGMNSIRDGRVLQSIPDEELFVSHKFSVIQTYFPKFPTYASSSNIVRSHGSAEREAPMDTLHRAAGEIDALIASRLPAQFGIDKKYIEADFNEEESVDPESFLTPTDPRSFPDCVVVLNATDGDLHRAAYKHIQAMVDAHGTRRGEPQSTGGGGKASKVLQEQIYSARLESEMLRRFFDGLQKFRDAHLEGGPYTESLVTWFQSCLMAAEPEHPFVDKYRWVSASIDEEFAPSPEDAQGDAAPHENNATSRMVSVSMIGAPLVSVFEENAVDAAVPAAASTGTPAPSSMSGAENAKLQRTVEEIAQTLLEVHRPRAPPHGRVGVSDDRDGVDTKDFAEEHWDAENLQYDGFDGDDDASDADSNNNNNHNHDYNQDHKDDHHHHHHHYRYSKNATPLNPIQKRKETWQQRTYTSRASVDYAALPQHLHSPSSKSSVMVDDRVLEELAALMKRNSADTADGNTNAAVAFQQFAEDATAATRTVNSAHRQSSVAEESENAQAWRALQEERLQANKELERCVHASRTVLQKAHIGPVERAAPPRGGEALTTQEYLMAYVMPALTIHMKNVVSIRPEDPIAALADALYQCGEVPKHL